MSAIRHGHRVSDHDAMSDGFDVWHEHARGGEHHRHYRDNGKTYFNPEFRSDGMRVKCEGHPTVEFEVWDDWCYRKESV